jgi:hypothetical protein
VVVHFVELLTTTVYTYSSQVIKGTSFSDVGHNRFNYYNKKLKHKNQHNNKNNKRRITNRI